MKLLVLGGTRFMGRAIVEAALERGHEVTLFNRSRTAPLLFGDWVQRLIGDRSTGDLRALQGYRTDAVIDVSAVTADWVSGALRALGGGFSHYTLISSQAALHAGQTSAPGFEGDRRYPAYCVEKLGAEQAVFVHRPAHWLILRPTLVSGIHDTVGRLQRMGDQVMDLRTGRYLEDHEHHDADAFAEYVLEQVEAGRTGIRDSWLLARQHHPVRAPARAWAGAAPAFSMAGAA